MSSTPVTVDFVEHLWLRRSMVAAGHTLLVYDYFLTFGDELRYIWGGRWTAVKLIFLLSRYGNLAGQTYIRIEEAGLLAHDSETYCSHFDLFASLFLIFSGELSHILVLMRAWAIWGCRRRIAAILIGCYLAYIVVLLATTITGFESHTVTQFQHLGFAGICVGVVSRYAWIIYVASLALDTTVFAMTLRSLLNYANTFRDLYPSPLLRLLVRDASAFFLASVFNDSFIIVCWTLYADDPRYFLAKSFALPLLSAVGQRVVLNLRGLQTRAYTTGDLSREVDRQIDAFREAGYWDREDDSWEEPPGQVRNPSESEMEVLEMLSLPEGLVDPETTGVAASVGSGVYGSSFASSSR